MWKQCFFFILSKMKKYYWNNSSNMFKTYLEGDKRKVTLFVIKLIRKAQPIFYPTFLNIMRRRGGEGGGADKT